MHFNVSVIIPVFNAQSYLEKAINSTLELEEVKEVILIEDGSTDNSLQICNTFSEKFDRVRLLRHPNSKNLGAGASRNLGLLNASFDYIAFLDADDFYLPNRFEVDNTIFSDNDDIDGVYNAIGVHFYSEHGRILFNKHMKGSSLTTVFEKINPDELFFALSNIGKFLGYFSLDGLTLKRSALAKMDALFNPHLRLHQDTEFLIRLSFYTKLTGGELKAPVTLRGIHDDNRILNLRNNKQKSIEKRELFWISLVDWAHKENIPMKYKNHYEKMSLVYNILNSSDSGIMRKVTRLFINDCEMFCKASYFNPIFYHIFGNSILSKIMVRVKQMIQKLFNVPFYEIYK